MKARKVATEAVIFLLEVYSQNLSGASTPLPKYKLSLWPKLYGKAHNMQRLLVCWTAPYNLLQPSRILEPLLTIYLGELPNVAFRLLETRGNYSPPPIPPSVMFP